MPRLAKKQMTKRLTLELNEKVRNRLEELRDEVGADTLTEVVRRALAVYDFVVTAKHRDGASLVLRGKDGEQVVEFF